MRYSQDAVVNAPVDRIDLEKWLFTLSDSEYRGASRGHRAAGSFVEGSRRGTVNVESMGGTLMIQRYQEVSAAPHRVEMLSTRTRAYVFHVVPAYFQVRWTMTATARTADTLTFRCTVETTMPAALRFAAALIGTPYFVRKHVYEETPAFAADLERKLVAV